MENLTANQSIDTNVPFYNEDQKAVRLVEDFIEMYMSRDVEPVNESIVQTDTYSGAVKTQFFDAITRLLSENVTETKAGLIKRILNLQSYAAREVVTRNEKGENVTTTQYAPVSAFLGDNRKVLADKLAEYKIQQALNL